MISTKRDENNSDREILIVLLFLYDYLKKTFEKEEITFNVKISRTALGPKSSKGRSAR